MKKLPLLVAASLLLLRPTDSTAAIYEAGTVFSIDNPMGAYGPLEQAAREAGAGRPAELIRLADEYATKNTLADNGRYTLALKAAGQLAAGQAREAVATARALEARHPGGLPSACAMWVYAVYLNAGEPLDAIRVMRRLHAAFPRETHWLDELAWVLSTHPSKAVRNAAEALRFGEGAIRVSNGRDPHPATALACALAEAGRYDDAVARQADALARAQREGWSSSEVSSMQRRLSLFKARSPYRLMLGPERIREMLAGTFDLSVRDRALRERRAPGMTCSLPYR